MTTTTYTSTNARPCPDCGLRRCPPRCGSLGLASIEWRISGGTNPTTFAEMYGMSSSTVPVTDVSQHPADYVTMTGVLEAFDNQPQSHVYGRESREPIPVRYLVMVFLGIVLAGLGIVLNEPVTHWVWSLIPR